MWQMKAHAYNFFLIAFARIQKIEINSFILLMLYMRDLFGLGVKTWIEYFSLTIRIFDILGDFILSSNIYWITCVFPPRWNSSWESESINSTSTFTHTTLISFRKKEAFLNFGHEISFSYKARRYFIERLKPIGSKNVCTTLRKGKEWLMVHMLSNTYLIGDVNATLNIHSASLYISSKGKVCCWGNE